MSAYRFRIAAKRFTATDKRTPYELAEELGLIGCIEGGPGDLAANAKKYIKEKLDAKDSR